MLHPAYEKSPLLLSFVARSILDRYAALLKGLARKPNPDILKLYLWYFKWRDRWGNLNE